MRRSFAPELASLALLAVLAAPSRAATDLDIVPSQSAFTCGGTCILGPLVGSPSDVVHADGTVDIVFIPGAAGELYARIAALQMITVEDIHLEVSCPPPMPPPAVVDVENLRILIDSNAFLRLPGGQFDCQTHASIEDGDLTVTLSTGAQIQVDLAGAVIGVVARTGGLNPGGAGAGIALDLPLEIAIDCGGAAQSLDLSLELDGRVLATRTFPAPVTYCTATANSLGCSASIGAIGSASVTGASGFVIECQELRNHKAGTLFYGVDGRVAIPFQGGVMCAQTPVVRTPLRFSGGSLPPLEDCSGRYAIDFNAWIAQQPPTSPLRIPGTRVNAQWWSRDPAVAFTTVLSNAIEFTIGL